MKKFSFILLLVATWAILLPPNLPAQSQSSVTNSIGDLLNTSAGRDAKGQAILNLDIAGSGLAAAGTTGSLPSMTGQTGKFLTNNGTIASWATITGGGTLNPSGSPVSGDLAMFTSGTAVGPAQDGSGNLNITVAGNITLTPGTTKTVSLKQAVLADAVDPTKQLQYLTAGIPTLTTLNGTIPSANFAAGVVPYTAPTGEFFNSIGLNGVVTSNPVREVDTQPGVFTVGDTNATITDDTPPSISVVQLAATLTAPRTYYWPTAANHLNGKTVTFVGSLGTINSTTPVTITSVVGDTFNGSSSITITEPYARRSFTSNPGSNNWTVSLGPSAPRTPMAFTNALSGSIVSIAEVDSAIALNYKATLTANRTLAFTGAIPDGREINLIITQDATGGRTLAMPEGTVDTPTSGAGVLTIASGANAKTLIHFVKNNTIYEASTILDLTPSVITGGTTLVSDSETGVISAGIASSISQGNVTSTKWISGEFIAASTRTVVQADLPLAQVGTIADGSNRTAAIYTDATRTAPTDGVTTSGSPNISSAATTFASTDLGQHITGAGIPANSYIGAVSVGGDVHVMALSSSRTSNVAVNATATATGVTLSVYGYPGTQVGTASGNVLASTIPATSTAISFTGLSAAVTSGTIYHVVLKTDATVADAANYINWAGLSAQVITSHKWSGSVWAVGTAAKTPSFLLWHLE